MKKLPISNSVFKRVIEENNCYVDKTKYVKMLEDYPSIYFFLSRPRRFGKTLFLDTLRAAYAGEKELFENLYLEKNWDWTKKHPIISISFGSGTLRNEKELEIRILEILKDNADKNGIQFERESIPGKFEELISKLYAKFNLRVVVLIDEYDKPILDNITKPVAKTMRDGLASFYSVLKDANQYLKFVFLTGVSRFSKTNIFSKLNNIIDLSLNKDYGNICGYTQIEMEKVFKEYLFGVNLKTVKEWYDGYNFLGNDVYNPFDILLFLVDKSYKPYWFQTGTPTFLLDLIKQKKYYLPDLDKIDLTELQLEEFDIDMIQLEVLLFQTGYLTIKKAYREGHLDLYELSIPNKEVQIGLNEYLSRMFFAPGENNLKQKTQLSRTIYRSLYNKNPAILEDSFKAFFESVPHDWYRKNDIANYEGYYNCVFYTFFTALGETVIPEDSTKKGDIDMAVITDEAVFIFEFKMKTNPQNAMQQIKNKGYYKKYLNDKKEIFLVGIEFDEKIKNISEFEWEELKIVSAQNKGK